MTLEIKVICARCNGDGIHTFTTPEGEVSIPCLSCGGVVGAQNVYTIDETPLLNIIKPSGTFYTYQIVEATDDTEYTELTTAQKNTYSMIISLGMIDFSVGTAIRTKLLDMFGEGTTTRTNLLAL